MTVSIATNPNLSMTIASSPSVLSSKLVVALNVVDLDDYVKKSDLDAMHVMTWGDETSEE